MFRKTAFRLAGFYLGVLMTISLFFSVVVYELSVQELQRGLRLPDKVLSQFSADNLPLSIQEWQDMREEQYREAKSRVIVRLFVTNLIIMIGGGILSYWLAHRTLRPIEAAHASLERFTADASHELRTPIAAMQSETEVALMNPKLSLAAAKAQLRSNLEELAKLTDLTTGLLRLARMDRNGLKFEQVPASTIVREAIDRTQSLAAKKNISLTHEAADKITVYADKTSLVEALVIMLDNAIKYSAQDTRVDVKVTKSQRTTCITIKDQGIGMRPDEAGHIFERFYRADTARTRSKETGYGIGLAIAKDIVEMHGGRIHVESKYGKGSVFKVYLPAHR